MMNTTSKRYIILNENKNMYNQNFILIDNNENNEIIKSGNGVYLLYVDY
jgi:hypothetical protein